MHTARPPSPQICYTATLMLTLCTLLARRTIKNNTTPQNIFILNISISKRDLYFVYHKLNGRNNLKTA